MNHIYAVILSTSSSPLHTPSWPKNTFLKEVLFSSPNYLSLGALQFNKKLKVKILENDS